MQQMCRADPMGRHCFCIEIDGQRGVKRCCRCAKWNIHGNDWTSDEDFGYTR